MIQQREILVCKLPTSRVSLSTMFSWAPFLSTFPIVISRLAWVSISFHTPINYELLKGWQIPLLIYPYVLNAFIGSGPIYVLKCPLTKWAWTSSVPWIKLRNPWNVKIRILCDQCNPSKVHLRICLKKIWQGNIPWARTIGQFLP